MKCKLSEKQRVLLNTIVLLGTIAYYDLLVVFPFLEYLNHKALFLHGIFNLVTIFAVLVIHEYGEHSPIIRKTAINMFLCILLFSLLNILIMNFNGKERASVCFAILACSFGTVCFLIETYNGIIILREAKHRIQKG